MRVCPHCQSDRLREFRTMFKRRCLRCGAILPWVIVVEEPPFVAQHRKKVKG